MKTQLLVAGLLGFYVSEARSAQTLDHAAMGHAMPAMDHSQMSGMDHSQMAPTAPRTPIPVLTDADRRAAFPPVNGHGVHDKAINSFWLIDQLEYQDADDGSTLAWDMSGWVGGDIDRLWLRAEGERSNGRTEKAEVQALWGHAIGPWWDVISGVRQDFKPGSPQTWAAFGLQGLALYNFETQATFFIGEKGQNALRLEGEYDILLTNKLILQPSVEANFYTRNDPERSTGSGLANTEAGVRLRYEIVPQFAPYVGVTWSSTYGKTADYTGEEGERRSEARFVAGLRLWF